VNSEEALTSLDGCVSTSSHLHTEDDAAINNIQKGKEEVKQEVNATDMVDD